MALSMDAHMIAKIGHANVRQSVDPSTSLTKTAKEKDDDFLQTAENLAVDTLAVVGGDKFKASQILDMKLQATNEMIAELANNSKQMTDEDFYERLTTLKLEHRKTLDLCEHMYKMKTAPFQTRAYIQKQFDNTYDGSNFKSTEVMTHSGMKEQSTGFPMAQSMDFLISAYRQRDGIGKDKRMTTISPKRSRDVSCKPPVGATQRPRTAGHVNRNRKSKIAWRETRASALRRKCHSAENLYAELQREEDRGELQPTNQTSPDEVVSRVNQLWDEIDVEDIENAGGDMAPPPGPLKRVRSLDRSISDYNRRKAYERNKERAAENMAKDDPSMKWRHRVTIPEPFNFSVRDEYLNKSKTIKSYEEELSRREQMELAECQKKFKANPVPAHVYMPMYESMMERQETRRQFVKHHRQEILQSTQEPFKFDQREMEKKRQKELQGKVNARALRSTNGERTLSVPRAKEVPSHIFEDRSERMREDQLLRQIKAKMRAEELLNQSMLPGQMAEREKAKMDKVYQKNRNKNANSSVNQFHPRTRNVPNFDRIHSKLANEKERNQGQLRYTKPEPFKLRTEERVRSNSRLRPDQKENENMNSSKRSYEEWNQSILLSKEIPQAQMTNSANSRDRRTKERLEEMRRREIEEEEQWRKQKKHQEELARYLRDNIGLVDPKKEIGDLTGRKTQELRQEHLRRSREYGQEVREIEERVKQRPLLVERQAQLCAKKQAEMKYANILKGAGVEETFVEDRGAAYRPEDADGYDKFGESNELGNESFGDRLNGRPENLSTMSVKRDEDKNRNYPEENASLSVSDRFGSREFDEENIVEELDDIDSDNSASDSKGRILI